MGKKRRYIHKAGKFGRKMFGFLDKLDGTQDSSLSSSKIDTAITKITITDIGNETFKFVADCIGPGTGDGDHIEGDKVVYTIDGAAVNANGIITIADAGAGVDDRDRHTASSSDPARSGSGAGDILVTPGQHTLGVTIVKGADTSAKLSKTKTQLFNIGRSVIAMTPKAGFLTTHADTDNVIMDLGEITITGNRPGATVAYNPASTGGGANGDSFKVTATIKTGDDAAALAAASHAAVDITPDAGAENHTQKVIAKLLDTDVASGKHVEVIVTLTARTAANADLPDTMTDTIAFVVP